jgi:hypothetical protein
MSVLPLALYTEIGADLAAVTATQLRGVLCRLIDAGHWSAGDPVVWVMMDAGYSPSRLAWLLRHPRGR